MARTEESAEGQDQEQTEGEDTAHAPDQAEDKGTAHAPDQAEDKGTAHAPDQAEDGTNNQDSGQPVPYGPQAAPHPQAPYQYWPHGHHPGQQVQRPWTAGEPPPIFPAPRPPVPLPRAPGWLPAAVLGVGVVASLLVTFDRPGIGLVITAVVAGLTALTALMVRPAIPESTLAGTNSEGTEEKTETEGTGATEDDGQDSVDTEQASDQSGALPSRYAWSAVYAVLATALLFTALFRDAGWVLVWTLSGSLFFASLAFATHNPASRRAAVSVTTGAVALLRNAVHAPRFLLQPVRTTEARGKLLPVLVTGGITAVLLLVFGLLLAFSDAVFSAFITDLLPAVELDASFTLNLLAMALTMVLTGAAVLTSRRHHPERPRQVSASPAGRDIPTWTWLVPLGALVLLFTVFLGVQAVAMFGGDDYVQEVAGVSYADYAREGFFQLVAVSILVLGVVGLAIRLVPSRPAATRTLRNAVLGLLCVLTLIILASAMMRLQLYIDTFGLTRMRITAEAWITWSAVVFILVIAAGVLNTLGRTATWLPRVTVALAGAALVVFAYANPDLRIAESHHDLELSSTDTRYLRGLSSDALSGLMELEGQNRDCAVERLSSRLGDPDDFASWNVSRHLARVQLEEEGLQEPPDSVDYSSCASR